MMTSEQDELSKLEAAVDWFAACMKKKLRYEFLRDGRTGWNRPEWARLKPHLSGAAADVLEHVGRMIASREAAQAVDIANYAMFIAFTHKFSVEVTMSGIDEELQVEDELLEDPDGPDFDLDGPH